MGIKKFYLKTDKDPGESVGEIYFEFTTEDMIQPFRAPEPGYEETLFQTNHPHPGPIFIPEQPITFPFIFSIEAFERDKSNIEPLTESPQQITIETFEELISNQSWQYNLTDIYFEVD